MLQNKPAASNVYGHERKILFSRAGELSLEKHELADSRRERKPAMCHPERIESGLPVLAFISETGSNPSISHKRRRAPFGPSSPWFASRLAGEKLSWRGRNFVEGFAAVNHCNLVQATMVNLCSGQCQILINDGDPAGTRHEYFHLVCKASAGSSLEVGNSVVALQSGELWRLDSHLFSIVRGGCEGGMHLVLALARRNVPANDAWWLRTLPHDHRIPA